MKIQSYLLALLLISWTAIAQEKIEADRVVGSLQYYDYDLEECSYEVNIKENAFDGILDNMVAVCERSGGWVGLDLGEKYVITAIAYSPASGLANNMLLGIFEGANEPDFGDAIPLYIIKEEPEENRMTSTEIACSRGFRYVRYVSPAESRCNVAELEFYGYKGEGDDSKLVQLTNLPTIVIHTVGAEDIVIKEKYIKGIVSVISEEGAAIYTDSLEIKGRGNSSWTFPKKPYRMKLYEKASLLGAPAKEKNWTLINNFGDKTLMRNLLAFDLSEKLEIGYTPFGTPVDVVLNGEYKGTYQLCDQIEVAQGRVEVEKMKEDDITLPNLSGGYLLEIDAYAHEEVSWFSSSMTGIPVTIKYPKDDEIVSEQKNYIKSFFDLMETALYSDNYKDKTSGYRKYIDVSSFLSHFLVGEISGNTDTYWSTYLYKKRNEDFFRFGPVWDFDIAYENDYRTFPINSNPDWVYATTGSSAGMTRQLVNKLFSDESFVQDLKDIYADYRDRDVLSEESLLSVVDSYEQQLQQSQQLNFIRWDIMNSMEHMNPYVWGSYEAEVENIRSYIRERLTWLDAKLDYSPGPVTSLTTLRKENQNVIVHAEDNKIYLRNLSEQKQQIDVVDMLGRKVFSGILNDQLTISSGSGMFLIHVSERNQNIHLRVKCIVK